MRLATAIAFWLILLLPALAQGQQRLVVLDPGHGGSNLGALGVTGVYEKDINLQVSERVARILANRQGLEVLLTREGDEDLPLEARTRIANENGADLFLSIHCNASFNVQANGAETFVLSGDAMEEESIRLERRRIMLRGRLAELEDEDSAAVVKDLLQRSAHFRSRVFAELLQSRLVAKAGMRNRGVKELAVVVLRGAEMPAALVELGFISNDVEGRRLVNPDYQERLAEAIAKAVVDMVYRLDREGVARPPKKSSLAAGREPGQEVLQ